MSYVTLATDNFDWMTWFYSHTLAFPVLNEWDRPRGRGRRFDLGTGMKLELLDNQREPEPSLFPPVSDRLHIVVEVVDIDDARTRITVESPEAQRVSWGALLFQIRDPDGTSITYLQLIDAAVREVQLRDQAGRFSADRSRLGFIRSRNKFKSFSEGIWT